MTNKLVKNILEDLPGYFVIIDKKFNKNKNTLEITAEFFKQMKFHRKSKSLIIKYKNNQYIPLNVNTLGSINKENKSTKLAEIKNKKAFTVDWAYNKIFITEDKGSSYKEDKSKIPIVKRKKNFLSFIEQLENLLTGKKEFIADEFCQTLKILLEASPIVYHNEYLLSCILYEGIKNINKKLSKNNRVKIFSLDKKFIEHVEGLELNFRVDVIVLCDDKIFIFENKFRLDRINQSLNALKCIEFKRYSERKLNYFQTFFKKIFDKILLVYEIGLGFSKIENEISTCINYKIYNKDALNLENYKTVNFFIAMRKNIKRFISICEDNKL